MKHPKQEMCVTHRLLPPQPPSPKITKCINQPFCKLIKELAYGQIFGLAEMFCAQFVKCYFFQCQEKESCVTCRYPRSG